MSLLRIGRNVSNMTQMAAFYQALGFQPIGPQRADMQLAAMLGVTHVDAMHFRLGAQILELTVCTPSSAPYPPLTPANAGIFQHIALLVHDIEAAATRAIAAGAKAISRNGPVQLPVESGGVLAWKFRDPDFHPLEFIQRPGATGYDHSAIIVEDIDRSVKFYENLGLSKSHSQYNMGITQEQLDGVSHAAARIISMRGSAGPGLELLGYQNIATPRRMAGADIAADRSVISSLKTDLICDPDGHFIQLSQSPV